MSSTTDECWEDFKQRAIPETAPEIQVTSLRNAFYHGAFSILEMIRAIKSTGLTLDDERIVRVIEEERRDIEHRLNTDYQQEVFRQQGGLN